MIWLIGKMAGYGCLIPTYFVVLQMPSSCSSIFWTIAGMISTMLAQPRSKVLHVEWTQYIAITTKNASHQSRKHLISTNQRQLLMSPRQWPEHYLINAAPIWHTPVNTKKPSSHLFTAVLDLFAIHQTICRIFPPNSPTHLDLIWIRCHERNALRKAKKQLDLPR